MDKNARLEELNKICLKCQEKAIQNFRVFSPKDCMYCKVGKEVHDLECPEWDKIDWNSSQWEHFYRH